MITITIDDGKMQVSGPSAEGHTMPADSPYCLKLENVVRRHVISVLQACNGNKSLAAEKLGIHRHTIDRILREVHPCAQ